MTATCLAMSFLIVAGSMPIDAGAVERTKQDSKTEESTQETTTDKNSEKTKETTDKETKKETEKETNKDTKNEDKSLISENTGSEAGADTATEAGDNTEKSADTKKSNSTGNTVKSSGNSKTDDNGNTILMTQAQRRKKFGSKTNPKRDQKVANLPQRPALNGFAYADFNLCNSYNSENGLGGKPVYLVGTITGIEKVYENAAYYGTAILVNDCDGYQWYMRSDIAKDKYELFRNTFLGKGGFIYGIYSGYSGVVNRPMMDILVLQPDATVPYDIKLFK